MVVKVKARSAILLVLTVLYYFHDAACHRNDAFEFVKVMYMILLVLFFLDMAYIRKPTPYNTILKSQQKVLQLNLSWPANCKYYKTRTNCCSQKKSKLLQICKCMNDSNDVVVMSIHQYCHKSHAYNVTVQWYTTVISYVTNKLLQYSIFDSAYNPPIFSGCHSQSQVCNILATETCRYKAFHRSYVFPDINSITVHMGCLHWLLPFLKFPVLTGFLL